MHGGDSHSQIFEMCICNHYTTHFLKLHVLRQLFKFKIVKHGVWEIYCFDLTTKHAHISFISHNVKIFGNLYDIYFYFYESKIKALFRNCAKKYFHTENLTHFWNFKALYLFDYGYNCLTFFMQVATVSGYITKNMLIDIRSQLLHPFVCQYVKCVEFSQIWL